MCKLVDGEVNVQRRLPYAAAFSIVTAMNSLANVVVISDLDGTLLDARTYSAEAAAPALETIKSKGISLVLSSSKTRAEIEEVRRRLGHDGPFIVENGGALFIPRHFFSRPVKQSIRRDGFDVVEFGIPYHRLRTALKEIAKAVGIDLRGFGDMSVADVSKLTGLSSHEALLAKQREYDEPFLLDSCHNFPLICHEAARRGLSCTKGGQFYHLLGPCDKGHACRFLLEHWRGLLDRSQHLSTIGIGDSANDLPMLAVVDRAILVQGPDGTYDPVVQFPHTIYAPGVGPVGWNAAVLNLFESTPL